MKRKARQRADDDTATAASMIEPAQRQPQPREKGQTSSITATIEQSGDERRQGSGSGNRHERCGRGEGQENDTKDVAA